MLSEAACTLSIDKFKTEIYSWPLENLFYCYHNYFQTDLKNFVLQYYLFVVTQFNI